ncbi:MAG: chemotaxis protein CheW [Gammaproteobacteria bacterium]
MASGNETSHILHQELALDTYLRTLLEELPAVQEEKQASHPEPIKPAVIPLLKPGQGLTVVGPVKPKRLPEARIKPEPTTLPLAPLAVMPAWAQHEFQAIFFKLGGLVLATPLTELSRTLKFDRKVTQLPNQPSWFMGLIEDQDKKIGVLDSGQLILGKTQGRKRDLNEQPFKSLLVTGDGNWALACDELLSIGKLTPEQVRWRTRRERRSWLIGTVIEQLTAVIDVNQLTPRRKQS